MKIKAKVKATGEELIVYSLQNGDWCDYIGMGVSDPPSAPKSGKKQFTKDEIEKLEEITC